MTKRNGFTIVDLVATVSVLGILVTIGIPAFSNTCISHPPSSRSSPRREKPGRLDADAISVGVLVGGARHPEMITHLAKICRDAAACGLPVVSHIYPRGEFIKDEKACENVRYAVRVAPELGVDLIKTSYPGSPEDFHKGVIASPARVSMRPSP